MTMTNVDDWLPNNEPDNRFELWALHCAVEIGGHFDPYFGDHTLDGKIFLEGWNGDLLELPTDRAIASFKKLIREEYALGYDVEAFCEIQEA